MNRLVACQVCDEEEEDEEERLFALKCNEARQKTEGGEETGGGGVNKPGQLALTDILENKNEMCRLWAEPSQPASRLPQLTIQSLVS